MSSDTSFRERYRRAVSDLQLRRNLLGFQRGWRDSRDARFTEYADRRGDTPTEEFNLLRHALARAKDHVIADQPAYFARFKAAAEANGASVYTADSPDDAGRYIAALCQRLGATTVVKTKSMVSEEIHLNHFLEQHGIRAVETDLGEWIVQLRHELPSHMVMPAIHLSRQQVGDTFTKATGHEVPRDDVAAQVGFARTALRSEFLAARVGMTGANALIAESGTTMIVTNEGNEALVTTLPQAQVVLVGYEKLVATYDDAMTQLRLLARSATGQHITTYTTFISGPASEGQELHYVFIDNGRAAMRADPAFAEALRCIRCAACASVCPPYQVVGGHVFGYIYSGAIGLVNTPFHHGLEHAAGPQSLCVSCNACQTVCPVDIPLPRQILDVRRKVVETYGLPWPKRLLLAVWSRPRLFQALGAIGARATRPWVRHGLLRLPLPPRHAWRTPPALATTTARQRLATVIAAVADGPLAQSGARGMTVAYFVQCLTDRMAPAQAEAAVRLIAACGARVVVPERQHCCGLPMLDSGDARRAKMLARQTIETLEATGADYIVSAANSCVVALAHDYAHLFRDEPAWQTRARRLAERTLDLATFLDRIAALPAGSLATSPPSGDEPAYTYHPFCQTRNVLGADGAAQRLLHEVCGLALRDLPESGVCCGFGGSTSIDAPEVGRSIVDRKLTNIDATGATIVVSDNPGCLLHLRGAADASGRSRLVVRHLAEVLADHLDRTTATVPAPQDRTARAAGYN